MKARELLADRSRWIQGCSARDANDVAVYASSPKAVSFCAEGAILHCYSPSIKNGEPYPQQAIDMLWLANEVARKRFSHSLQYVNDKMGYDAVMQVLREADV